MSPQGQSTTTLASQVVEARQVRKYKEAEVRKLHNRIALLQHEEEKALKRIEETRQKAHIMLENKI